MWLIFWRDLSVHGKMSLSHFEDIEGGSMRFLSKIGKTFKKRKHFSLFIHLLGRSTYWSAPVLNEQRKGDLEGEQRKEFVCACGYRKSILQGLTKPRGMDIVGGYHLAITPTDLGNEGAKGTQTLEECSMKVIS